MYGKVQSKIMEMHLSESVTYVGFQRDVLFG